VKIISEDTSVRRLTRPRKKILWCMPQILRWEDSLATGSDIMIHVYMAEKGCQIKKYWRIISENASYGSRIN
jgi:hypothetical protein